MNQFLQQRRYEVYYNDRVKQMTREVVVELFQEILQPNPDANKQVIQLTDTLEDIIKNKVDNYKVEVYGVSLKEY